jgi:hypothetical protein
MGAGRPSGNQLGLDMHASVQLQGVDVGKQGIEEVVTDSLALPGMENPPTIQVGERRRKDLDLHSARLRSSRLSP